MSNENSTYDQFYVLKSTNLPAAVDLQRDFEEYI